MKHLKRFYCEIDATLEILPWKEFEYHGKDREALVFGENDYGNIACWTPDGYRTFKPEKMFDIRDTTQVVA